MKHLKKIINFLEPNICGRKENDIICKMRPKTNIIQFSAAILVTLTASIGFAETSSQNHGANPSEVKDIGYPKYDYPIGSLESGFVNPPQASKPRTWMHSMNSNMSKIGFTKDLEAMAEAGIGGLLLFTVSAGIPKGDVLFGSAEHYDIIKHAAAEAERLGLSFGMHNSDGWTASGGPWIKPEDSMKLLVWTEAVTDGGKVKIKLPQPTARHGLYVDESVVAYPATEDEIIDSTLTPKITASKHEGDLALLTDHRWDEPVQMRGSKENKSTIVLDYSQPTELNHLWVPLDLKFNMGRLYSVAISDDGENYEYLVENKKLGRVGKREYVIDLPLKNIETRFLKIEWGSSPKVYEVSATRSRRHDSFVARTSVLLKEDHKLKRLADIDDSDLPTTIAKNKTINLSKYLDEDGMLRATLPKGKWNIMRFGYTSTGAVNGPASVEGKGLEADKMDRKAIKLHYDSYVGKIADDVRDVAPNALQYMEIDSFEVGGQNWTHDYLTKFEKHHGYSLVPFLPVYAGKIVESKAATDKVLWDVRLFNSQLITDNYFDYFTELTHQDGLISYIEPYSFNAAYNELQAAGKTDIPMGEFWLRGYQEITIATSAGHIYGKPIISTEAFTALKKWNWRTHPGVFKSVGDDAWSQGVNEYMFHRYAHQPNTHVEPGMTMAGWGSNIDRHQTWWRSGAASAWFKYIARGSYVLRQGYPVSDLLIFIGEGSPNSILERRVLNNLPLTINYDNVNDDVILNRLTVSNGRLTLPEGTNYKALILKNHYKMTLPLLRKLADFSRQGVKIIGSRPKHIAKYNASQKDRDEFQQLINEVWKSKNTLVVGKKINWENLYKTLGLEYDLNVLNAEDPANGISYTHRKIDNNDLYFLANTEGEAKVLDIQISKQDLNPVSTIEHWDAKSGKMKQVAQYTQDDAFINIPLHLDNEESAFIVIKQAQPVNPPVVITSIEPAKNTTRPIIATRPIMSNGKTQKDIQLEVFENNELQVTYSTDKNEKVTVKDIPSDIEINTPWKISFNRIPHLKPFETNTLFDWSTHANDEIKHYSGTALYSTSFNLPADFKVSNINNYLDLGVVDVTANIIINGYRLPTLWASPFKVDVTDYLKSGSNTLDIEVTNQWTNRLIGDERYERTDGYMQESDKTRAVKKMPAWYINNEPMPKGKRTTFSAYHFYDEGAPLELAGLKGPVRILATKSVTLKP